MRIFGNSCAIHIIICTALADHARCFYADALPLVGRLTFAKLDNVITSFFMHKVNNLNHFSLTFKSLYTYINFMFCFIPQPFLITM